MKIRHFFSIVPPIAFIILTIFAVVFLGVGIFEFHNSQVIVNSYETVTGTVVGNDYLSHTDPEDSARVTWTYHPVVQFTATNGREVAFTDRAGSYPARYDVGETVEVYYNPDEPQDALVKDWMSLWWGPLIFLVIGSLPIIGMAIWFIVGYIVAEKRYQASRAAYRR
jgi:hypothetical protein